jgi:hypothetical protein
MTATCCTSSAAPSHHGLLRSGGNFQPSNPTALKAEKMTVHFRKLTIQPAFSTSLLEHGKTAVIEGGGGEWLFKPEFPF